MTEPDFNEASTKHRRWSSERVNFIIAVCAILISAASFYATYLQATSAEKQVKAMTFPLMQFGHGNTRGGEEKVITFSLMNAGLGPAIIKSIEFRYQSQSHSNFFHLLKACCSTQVESYLSKQQSSDEPIPQFVTSPVVNTIIAGQDELVFFQFEQAVENESLWSLINELRFEMNFSVCYCSMLDDCFESSASGQINPVQQCD